MRRLFCLIVLMMVTAPPSYGMQRLQQWFKGPKRPIRIAEQLERAEEGEYQGIEDRQEGQRWYQNKRMMLLVIPVIVFITSHAAYVTADQWVPLLNQLIAYVKTFAPTPAAAYDWVTSMLSSFDAPHKVVAAAGEAQATQTLVPMSGLPKAIADFKNSTLWCASTVIALWPGSSQLANNVVDPSQQYPLVPPPNCTFGPCDTCIISSDKTICRVGANNNVPEILELDDPTDTICMADRTCRRRKR